MTALPTLTASRAVPAAQDGSLSRKVRESLPSAGPSCRRTVTVLLVCESGKLGQVVATLRSPAMACCALVPWKTSISCAYSSEVSWSM
jgi:hypothetical protein